MNVRFFKGVGLKPHSKRGGKVLYGLPWMWPPPVTVVNEGLGWDSLLNM